MSHAHPWGEGSARGTSHARVNLANGPTTTRISPKADTRPASEQPSRKLPGVQEH